MIRLSGALYKSYRRCKYREHIMSSLMFTQHALIAVTVTVALTIFYANCNIHITGGSVSFSVYQKLGCKIVVDGDASFHATRIILCALLCTKETQCSVVHYNDNSSLCMIDTRPANTLVVGATPGDTSWTSYLRYQYTCDSNWTQLDKSCYHVPSVIYDWTNCSTYCQSHSSHLATIRSDREMQFALGIIEILPLDDKYLHIGGEQNPDNSWSWINGEPWDFTRWYRYPVEPSNIEETCLAIFHRQAMPMWGKYDWNDIYCTQLGYCLCEKSAVADFIEPPGACIPDK